jgi:hypothetical protein
VVGIRMMVARSLTPLNSSKTTRDSIGATRTRPREYEMSMGTARRCRYRGADGTARWVALGVIANNLLSAATFLNVRATA